MYDQEAPLSSHRKSKRQTSLYLLALLGAYLLAVGVLILVHTTPYSGAETDGVSYMIVARDLFTPAFAPPTYGGGIGIVTAIWFANLLVADVFLAAKLISGAAGLLYLVASWKVMSAVFGEVPGFMGALLLLVNPVVLTYSAASMSDMLGAALPMLALWLLLGAERRGRAFGAGLCLGLAWTARYGNLAFWPLVALPAYTCWAQRRRGMELLVAGLAGLAIGASPQWLVNTLYFGSPFYTENWRNLAAMVHEWDYVNRLTSFSEFLRQDWMRLGVAWLKRFVVEVPEALFNATYWPLGLAVAGLGFHLHRSLNRSYLLAWAGASVLCLGLISAIWRIEPRYFLPILPLIFVSASYGWHFLARKQKTVLFAGVVFTVLVSLSATARNVQHLMTSQQAVEYETAGAYIERHSTAAEMVLSSRPHIFFFGNRHGLLFSDLAKEATHDLHALVTRERIGWVVFDERTAARQFPALAWLLDPMSAEAAQLGWHAAHTIESPMRVVVWRTRFRHDGARRQPDGNSMFWQERPAGAVTFSTPEGPIRQPDATPPLFSSPSKLRQDPEDKRSSIVAVSGVPRARDLLGLLKQKSTEDM